MKSLYVLLFVILISFSSANVNAQGCVAVKNMSSCSLNWGEEAKGFQLSLNYRYFRSYKHFVGNHEEKHRVEQGTEVINNDNSLNLGVNYTFNNRFSAGIIVPYIWIDRSSMYEHLGNPRADDPSINPNRQRFHTQSQGIGDIRLIGYYNALQSYQKGGLTLGLGVKVPTGDYKAKDDFHKPEGIVRNVVDQSMQLGDGGTGLITEFDFNHIVTGKVYGYAQGMYLLNPRNTNGVLRSNTLQTNPSTGEQVAKSNEFSVPDQYMVRAGGRFVTNGIQASLGARMECIPSKDLADKSQGFRRPGYVVSAEPSLFYTTGQHTFGVNFPIAIERNRTRSQIDIARGVNPSTGKPFHGDAAFADWLLSLTYAYKL
jgi:hypothetical protein